MHDAFLFLRLERGGDEVGLLGWSGSNKYALYSKYCCTVRFRILRAMRVIKFGASTPECKRTTLTLFCHVRPICQEEITFLLSHLPPPPTQHYNLLSLTAPSPTSVFA